MKKNITIHKMLQNTMVFKSKKIKTFAAVCSMLFFMNSCEDDLMLEPENNITQTSFYQTELQIKQAVTGVYGALVNASSRGGFDVNFYLLASEVRSNNYDAINQDGNRDWFAFNRFQETSNAETLEIMWQDGYRLINYANNILVQIDNVPFASEALREQYRAETKFLRAYTYFELIKVFGRVPLVERPVSAEEGASIPRTDLETIYDFLTSDLESTVDALPASYGAEDKGRVTKWAAHAMLGRIYLTGAGYPMNRSQYLTLAKNHLQLVIQQEGGNVQWAANYADLFKSANDNRYHIFEIQHISGGVSAGTLLPSYVTPTFGTNDPLFVNHTSMYSSGSLAVSTDLINTYEEGDLRYPLTIKTTFIAENNQEDDANYFVKFREPGMVISNRYDWPINFPIIRYADVILMYAEILNSEGNTTQAVTYLNKIRQRAGLQDVPTSISQADFTTALRKERRVEFAGEGVYWHDLVRWNIAVDVMNAWAPTVNHNVVISTNDYIYPIPLSQIQTGGYDQNP